ncbi:Midasin [Entamoeba marina]
MKPFINTHFAQTEDIIVKLLNNSIPCLIEGPSGCGKSSLLKHVAEVQNAKLLSVHFGDDVDAKALIGSYITSDSFSEFTWKDGSLTSAIKEGFWFLLEDVDTAPPDVISLILPLLKTRTFFIPNRAESVPVHPNFRLIATRTLHKGGMKINTFHSILSSHFTVVSMPILNNQQLLDLLQSLYERIQPLAPLLLQTHSSVELMQINPTLRQLLSLCKRVQNLIPIGTRVNPPTTAMKHIILYEADSVYLSNNLTNRIETLQQIAKTLQIPSIDFMTDRYKPLIDTTTTQLTIGHVTMKRNPPPIPPLAESPFPFSRTQHSLCLMEKLADCIVNDEPILLVGETGTGKTTMVQQLASLLHQKLVVYNLNQQTESSDLVGGFKPVQLKLLCHPLRIEFIEKFTSLFPQNSNEKFFNQLNASYEKQDFSRFLTLIIKACELAEPKVKLLETSERLQWRKMNERAQKYKQQAISKQSGFAFSFIEGDLITALRNGHWILLDEINLASHETLERISGLLDGESILLTEIGEVTPVPRHPNFRLFANMNPPTDVGKKDLSPGIKSRFHSIQFDEIIQPNDLKLLVVDYLTRLGVTPPSELIVQFHLKSKKLAHDQLFDGAGQRPLFSLRTLCLALQYITDVTPFFGFERALYEGISMSYLTQLSRESYPIMEQLINETFNKTSNTGTTPKHKEYINYGGYFIEKGEDNVYVNEKYILTKTTKKRLENIARIAMSKRYPILLQGPTSSGKTSLVEYLANATGHRMVRVNNHEQTDVQEYLGSYVPTEDGKLVFQEGILVEAVRKGYWIVLDELNLAPSEVLEALNRLLDFNRELYIPETQETIQPHPQFMLFATQNPPNTYGGRKHLSRAFRNRFIELHFDEIPDEELEVILEKRSLIPPSYCKKLVAVLKDLQKQRSMTQLFGGKHSFITLRELFKWADRHADSYEQLAKDGYFILAEKMRNSNEKSVIQTILEKNLKVKLDLTTLYDCDELTIAENMCKDIVWTPSMKRLFCLILNCVKHKEPVLLIGETGCGKTTVCQILAAIMKQRLRILNCHQHTETADFIGGMRPIRNKDQTTQQLTEILQKYFNSDESLQCLLKQYTTQHKKDKEIDDLISEYKTLFKWYDGPLIEAMTKGDMFLIDEINMAEDSVLERLNSVLEPTRMMTIAEKTSNEIEEVKAVDSFRIFGTMNPGGDFGKRELSPAMRNRFTEIYVKTFEAEGDLLLIVQQKIQSIDEQKYARGIVQFLIWAEQRFGKKISVRNCLAWTNFMNECKSITSPQLRFIHAAHLVVIDSLKNDLPNVATDCMTALNNALRLCGETLSNEYINTIIEQPKLTLSSTTVTVSDFSLSSTTSLLPQKEYCIDAPTTSSNILHLFRALTLHKAILMEGSPGVGKTTIIEMLASMLNIQLYRINLSEHTDISDLLGTDLPLEGSSGGFGWCDGLLLRAMKSGSWVLLDELNLASQSVLEGLNSLLDHRATVFIPELNMEVKCPETFRLFASQNPLGEGSGRKGLPQSFINRFTEVYVNKMTIQDMSYIVETIYPRIPHDVITSLITFVSKLEDHICKRKLFGRKGEPWEFNLRDVLRFSKLYTEYSTQIETEFNEQKNDTFFFYENDMKYAMNLWLESIGNKVDYSFEENNSFTFTHDNFIVGEVEMERVHYKEKKGEMNYLLPSHLSVMKRLMKGISNGWLVSLIGNAHCGKTSIVKTIAQSTGHILKEFSMNTSVDTIDLIGGYEQLDFERHRRSYLQDIKDTMMFCYDENILHIYQMLLTCIQTCDLEGKRKDKIFEETELQILTELSNVLNDDYITSELNSIKQLQLKKSTGSFEWVDGIVVKCMKRGYWLVMENVNFCNPTVLDRVSVNGSPIVITPHPNFRVIFTSNPVNGEISRAMRNRALELYVPDLQRIDIERILCGFNIPISIVKRMCSIHYACENISLLHLIRWGRYIGTTGIEHLKEAYNMFYVNITSNNEERILKQKIFEESIEEKNDSYENVVYDLLTKTHLKQFNIFVENISIGNILSKFAIIIPYIYHDFVSNQMEVEDNSLNSMLIESLQCYSFKQTQQGNEWIATVLSLLNDSEHLNFLSVLHTNLPSEQISILLQIIETIPSLSRWNKSMLILVMLMKKIEMKEKQNETSTTLISRSYRKITNVYSKYMLLEQTFNDFLDQLDTSIDSIVSLQHESLFTVLVLRVLLGSIGLGTEIQMEKFIIICVILRSISPIFVELTTPLFKQYSIDETLIGRLWSSFSIELYPKHLNEYITLHNVVNAKYNKSNTQHISHLIQSCYSPSEILPFSIPNPEEETQLSPLFEFLDNISVVSNTVNGKDCEHNSMIQFYQLMKKTSNSTLFNIPIISHALQSLWKQLPNLPFLQHSRQFNGASLLYQSVIPRARSYFASKTILDVHSVPVQLGLLENIKNILFDSSSDVNKSITTLLEIIHSTLTQLFNKLTLTNGTLQNALLTLSPKLSELYNNSIVLSTTFDRDHEGFNIFSYGNFIYNAFMIPCIDPMEYPKHFLNVASQRISLLTSQLQAVLTTRTAVFGKGFETYEQFLKNSIQNVENESKEYHDISYERTSDMKYENLYQEFSLFNTSNGDFIKIQELFNTICSITKSNELPGIIARETMWQEQTEYFIQHIQKDFPLFVDITTPILFGLYLLKTGIRIELFKKILMYSRNQSAERMLKSVITFPVNVLDIPNDISTIGDFILNHIEQKDYLHNISILKVLLVNIEKGYSGDINTSIKNTLPLFTLIAEEEALTFKYKTKVNELAVDEVAEEEEYRQEFPDFFIDVQDLLQQQTLEDQQQPMEIEHKPKQKKGRKWIDEHDISFIIQYIENIIEGKETTELFTTTMEDRNENLIGISTPFHYLFIKEKQSILVQNKQEISIDLNKDGSVYEVKELLKLLDVLQKRILSLLVEFPENEMLNKINTIIERINTYPKTAPLMKFLITLHILFGELQNWQTVAARHVSLESEMTLIANVIMKWRNWQLKSWNVLAENIMEQHRIAAREWFVRVWKMVQEYVSTDVSNEYELMFLENMNQFMHKCTYGQFIERIHLLEMLSKLTTILSTITSNMKYTKLCIIFTQIKEYYLLFKQRVLDQLESSTKPIIDKIRDFVRLTKWNDINYFKLQDQIEKSNRKLFSFKREFDKILKQSVQPIVQSETFESSQMITEKIHSPTFTQLDFIVDMSKGNGNRVQEIAYYINKIAKLHHNKLRPCTNQITSSERDGLSWLELLEDQMIERVKELQGMKGKEGVKLKKRALLDLLETLETLQLSHSRKTVNYGSITLETILRKDCNLKGTSSIIKRINEYHFKTLSKYQLFNKVKVKPSTELNGKEIEYSQNYVNNLYSMCLLENDVLLKQQSLLLYFDQILCILNTNEQKYIKISHTCLLKSYVFVTRIHNLIVDLLSIEDSLKTELNTINTTILSYQQSIKKYLESSRIDSYHFLSSSNLDDIKTMTSHSFTIVNEIEKMISQLPMNISHNFNTILNGLKEFNVSIDEELPSYNTINELLEESLVLCQILFKAANTLTNEEDDTFKGVHQYVMEAARITDTFKENIEICLVSDTTNLLNLLERVRNVIHEHFISSLHIHKSLRKFTMMCINTFGTLYQDGFCNQEETEADGEGEKGEEFVADGTGMGEGKGLDDVSKEIKDQEQLAGLQGEKQEEQNPQDKQEMDKGFDMQQDFDGEEYEDPQDEQNGNENEEDMDERDQTMGDVDKDKREILDAKMWDEEDDNNKEMEEENAIGQGKEGEADQMGSDDEGDLKNEKQKKSKEQNEEEEMNETKTEKGNEEGSEEEENNDKMEEDNNEFEFEEAEKLQTLPGKDEQQMEEEEEKIDEFNIENEGNEQMSISEEEDEEENNENVDEFDIDALNDPNEKANEIDEEKAEGENDDDIEKNDMDIDMNGDKPLDDDNKTNEMNSNKNEDVQAENNPIDAYGVEENTGLKSGAKIDSKEQQDGEGTGDNVDNNTKVGNGDGSATGTSAQDRIHQKVQQDSKANGDVDGVIQDLNMTKTQEVIDGEKEGNEMDEYAQNKKWQWIKKKEGEGEGEQQNVLQQKDTTTEQQEQQKEIEGIMEEDNAMEMEQQEKVEQYIRERIIEPIERETTFGTNQKIGENTQMIIEDNEKKLLMNELNNEVFMNKKTSQSAMELCEKLRIVLEPSLASQMKGDYRTGKKINMKKVIPYIASGFKKDKIWLRRTRAQKRDYQILLAIDDSQSMALNSAGEMALETVALLSAALSKLEVGELSVIKFGSDVRCVHKFSSSFTSNDGANLLQSFMFEQEGTDMVKLMKSLYIYLHESGLVSQRFNSSIELDVKQIIFILSDGRFSDKNGISKILRDYSAMKTFVVFIILDNPSNESILEMKSVSFSNGAVNVDYYMDNFPFPYYILLHDLTSLPSVLAEALRQWFEMTSTQN